MPDMRSIGLALVLTVGFACAQGRTDYANYETPQVKPIAVARVSGHDYLLVCNTPDGSVEVYDTDETLPAAQRFLARVPVGMEPSSVLWDASRGWFFTTDWLSDSVTSVQLTAPGGPGSLTARVLLSRNVGDEPMHCSLTPDKQILLVTFKTKSAMGAFDPATLLPVAASSVHPAPTERIDLLDGGSATVSAIKEPRTILHRDGKTFVLGTKGGNHSSFDFDLFSQDLATGALTPLGGLGSTNLNMAFGSNGDLWVVGGEAQNLVAIGGPAVAAAPTGFLESTLYRVSGAGTANVTVTRRDLNEKPTASGSQPVVPQEALTMPTDVVVFDRLIQVGGPVTPAASGTTVVATSLQRKVYIACMSVDRVGVIIPQGNDPLQWGITRIDIPVAPGSSSNVSGPRGLALKRANQNQANDPGNRLYVLNRLDNSVSIINAANDTFVETIALKHDPTPDYIIEGREFLYSAKHSSTHFVSCASCHTDGRTDALVWNLGSTSGLVVPFPTLFIDSPTGATIQDLAGLIVNGFDTNKGNMVTQSLQGLLNWEVEPDDSLRFVTNAPYHWRGDRLRFTDFNEAFVNLFGLTDISTDPTTEKGISDSKMKAFETFINSIHYPPNPEQPESRVFSGTFGTANQNDGSGGLLGLKLFHTQPLGGCGSRSCIQCHALPESSNNRFTEFLAGGGTGRQPIDSAAMRGLFQKERRLDKDASGVSSVVTGTFGLEHHGVSDSMNDFIEKFFTGDFTATELVAMKQFSREMDWGTAPMVGRILTLIGTQGASTADLQRIGDFQNQARLANAGLSVRGRIAGATSGWWFDPRSDQFIAEPGGGAISLNTLVGLRSGDQDRLVFIVTPLGSERRLAAPSGQASSMNGPAPSNVTVLPMLPNTAYELVPQLTKNWVAGPAADDFTWTNPFLPTPLFPKSLRLMQAGLINDAGGAFGLGNFRHDAPRRIRVAGTGILPGAVVHVHVPWDNAVPIPNPSGPLTQLTTRKLTVPIYPTSVTVEGAPVWESAVELEPLAYYVMMCGGPFAPGVPEALADIGDQIPENPTGMFQPLTYNWHYFQVENPGGQISDVGWVPIEIN